jgi:Xaa-Pro aminopeptidase
MSVSLYTQKRTLLRQKAQAEIVVIPGNSLVQYSVDAKYDFEQEGNFLYLTGLAEPDLTLVFIGDEQYLFAPDYDPVRAAFDGAVPHAELSRQSGVKNVLSQAEGWELIQSKLSAKTTVGVLEPLEVYSSAHHMFSNPSRQYVKDKLVSLNPQITFEDLRQPLALLRMIKSAPEIKLIQEAIDATGDLLNFIETVWPHAKTETEVMALSTAERIKMGYENAYHPIIASGVNAVTLHYNQNNGSIKRGDFLLMDIGLRKNGYCADITRTVSTQPSKRQQVVYDAVLAVQKHAMNIIKPGVTFKDYEEQVTAFMSEQLKMLGLAKDDPQAVLRTYYPHSTSHFLGVDVHDIGDYTQAMQPGMVITVEPGIYIREEAIGVRLEDNIVVTKDGYKNLSAHLPKSSHSLTIGGV